MSDLLYKPSLQYPRNYNTEGSTPYSNDDSENLYNPISDYIDKHGQVKDSLDALKVTMLSFPKDIYDAIKIPLDGVEEILESIDPEIVNRPVENDSLIVTPQIESDEPLIEVEPEDGEVPDPFDSTVTPIEITVPVIKSKVEKINEDYAKDMAAICEDFIGKMEKKVGIYISNVFTVLQEVQCALGDIAGPYTGNSKDIDKNYKHLSDAVVRSEIQRNQKLRMFKKLFGPDQTTAHLKLCKASYQLKARYYDAEYGKNKSYLDINSNTILSDSRLTYDKNYKENLFNLYKYLNSAVILIDETLTMHLQEMQSKAYLKKNNLMKEEGIK